MSAPTYAAIARLVAEGAVQRGNAVFWRLASEDAAASGRGWQSERWAHFAASAERRAAKICKRVEKIAGITR